ncbi:tetratricopeptide repeat-containing protein [Striga asiatica]|uniref:Tetratricopeptide repeat-containing protein n=1 Tax=Striga asiatica TaxID=4170 RepID=A0A5A7QCI3_STRAF|nr:tetratricopeptide repeat-containing protein [Striga asiatica]
MHSLRSAVTKLDLLDVPPHPEEERIALIAGRVGGIRVSHDEPNDPPSHRDYDGVSPVGNELGGGDDAAREFDRRARQLLDDCISRANLPNTDLTGGGNVKIELDKRPMAPPSSSPKWRQSQTPRRTTSLF